MSVWDVPYYRGETLLQVARYTNKKDLELSIRHIDGLLDFQVEPHGDFSTGVIPGNFRDNVKKQPEQFELFLGPYYTKEQLNDRIVLGRDDRIAKTLLNKPKINCGIKAVYRFFAKIYELEPDFIDEYDAGEEQQFCSKLFKSLGSAAYATKKTWEKRSEDSFMGVEQLGGKSVSYFRNAAQALTHAWSYAKTNDYERLIRRSRARDPESGYPYFPYNAYLKNNSKDFKLYRFKNFMLVEYKNESHLLLKKDLDRLLMMLESTASMIEYFYWYERENRDLSRRLESAFIRIMDLYYDAFMNSTSQGCNWICRANDVALHIYQAELASDITQLPLELQWEKVANEKLEEYFDIRKLLDTVKRFKPKEAFELLLMHKFLPCPDFCLLSPLHNVKSKSEERHPMVVEENVPYNLEDLKLYIRWSKIRTFHQKHGRLPGKIKRSAERKPWHIGYHHRDPIEVPFRESADIDLKASFTFRDYQDCEYELVKDKSMAPKYHKKLSEKREQHSVTDTNQLVDYLMNPSFRSQKEIEKGYLEDLKAGMNNIGHKIALKPEAKKPNSRVFYMATGDSRRILSTFEANIAEYLTNKPGNVAGVDDIEVARRHASMAQQFDPLTGDSFVKKSFDLAGFSPNSDPTLRNYNTELWCECFGIEYTPIIRAMFTGANIYWEKYHHLHSFTANGQDLEGYNARNNTDLHIDIMAYSVRICRERELIHRNNELLVLIDDGLMKEAYPTNTPSDKIMEVTKLQESIYNMAGYSWSWDKFYISRKFSVFLNEMYYNGIKVTPGIKAYLRIGKPLDNACRTFSDDVNAIEGQVSGAIKAGSSYFTAYMLYIKRFYRIIKAWTRFKFTLKDKHVFCSLFPVALGGLGIKSLPQIVTNESFDPITSGISNLKTFCRRYPENAPIVNDLLQQNMRIQTPAGFMRNAKGIRMDVKCLNLRRFQNLMSRWLLTFARNPLLKSIGAYGKDITTDNYSEILFNQPVVRSSTLKWMYEISPESFIDAIVGKLQNSSTAQALVGFRTCVRIQLKNRYELEHLVTNFGKLSSWRL